MNTTFQEYIDQAQSAFQKGRLRSMRSHLIFAQKIWDTDKDELAIEDQAQFHRLNMLLLVHQKQEDPRSTLKNLQDQINFLEELEEIQVTDYYHLSGLVPYLTIDFFEEIIPQYPNDVHLIGDLGYFFFLNEQYESAITCYKKGLGLTPDHQMLQTRLRVCLKGYIQSLCNEEMVPREEENYGKVMDLLIESGKTSTCLHLLKTSEDYQKHLSSSQQEEIEGLCYYKIHHWEKAFGLWEKLLQEGHEFKPGSLLCLARVQLWRNEVDQSVELLQSLVNYFKAEIPVEPNATLEQWLETWSFDTEMQTSDRVTVHAMLSECFLQLKRGQEALEEAQKADELLPHNPHTYLALSRAYFSLGDEKLSIQSIQQAYALGLTQKKYHLELSELYFALKDWKMLIETLEAFFKENAITERTSYMMGYAYFYEGSYEKAIQYFQYHVKHHNTGLQYENALYLLVRAFFLTHQFVESVDAIHVLLSLYKDDEEAYHRMALFKARVAYEVEDHQTCINILLKSSEFFELAEPYTTYLQIALYMKSGSTHGQTPELNEHIRPLSTASLIPNPAHGTDFVLNARIYEALGMAKESVEAYESAGDIGYQPFKNYDLAIWVAKEYELFDETIRIYPKCIKAGPKVFDFNNCARYAYALLRKKRFEEAIEAYHHLINTYPEMDKLNWAKAITLAYKESEQYDKANHYNSIYLHQQHDDGMLSVYRENSHAKGKAQDPVERFQILSFWHQFLTEDEQSEKDLLEKRIVSQLSSQ